MKRISLRNKTTKTNGFFDGFQPEIWNALADDAAAMEEYRSSFYVADRPHAGTRRAIKAMLERTPDDLADLYKNTSKETDYSLEKNCLKLGYYELDLIDFLLTVRSNRVLNLIGSVGVGKTTFLSYIFQEVRKNTNSLKHFVPITVSFTNYPKKSLNDADLFQMVWQKTRDSLRSEISWREPEFADSLAAKLSKLLDFGTETRRSALLELIDLIVELFQSDGSKLEPIFIFDNLDQLEGASVASVSTFARALFLETRSAVIIAMRPPAFATHAETDAHKGAFHTFWINLPPPYLNLYFSRRLQKILSKERVIFEVEGSPISIELPDVKTAVANIAKNILTESNQLLVLDGIANNNLRKAGRAFVNFLQYRGLTPELLFSVSDNHTACKLPGGYSELLLNGIMLGANQFYRDNADDKSIVSNVFHFECTDYATDYLIQYRVLALLDWAVTTIEREQLVDWLQAFGYERQHIKLCVEHMLRRGLIYSPESEDNFEDVRYATQSQSGKFYLSELCSHNQYLWHTIPDIPLEHTYFSNSGEKEFVWRIRSMFELLSLVMKYERQHIERAAESQFTAILLGTIERSGLLQRRILSGVERLIHSAGRSNHDPVREAAAEFRAELMNEDRQTREIEASISHILVNSNLAISDNVTTEPIKFHSEWAPHHRVELRAPATLAPAATNQVKIECELAGPDSANILYGRLESINCDDRFDEMIALNCDGRTGKFSGYFAVPWESEVRDLPDIRLSLFADSRPILRRAFTSKSSKS